MIPKTDKVALHHKTRIFYPTFDPDRLGASGWGTVRTNGAILHGPSIGRGPDFEESYFFTALKQVFVERGRWEDTVFYVNMVEKIDAGQALWKCKTEGEFLRRLEVDVRGIYESMLAYGFLTQDEVIKKASAGGIIHPLYRYAFAYHTSPGPDHEIRIALSEAGDILLIDGSHRLAIAKLLRVPLAPALVAARHENWANFRAFVSSYVNIHDTDSIKFKHPDLAFATVGMSAFDLISRRAADYGIPEYYLSPVS